MLHGHDFNHVQIGLLRGSVDGEHGIHDIGGELLGKGAVKLSAERGSGDGKQQFTVNRTLDLELVEELDSGQELALAR